jgi:integrase
MTTRGLAPGTIKTRVNNVRSVIQAAVRDRRIPDDPSAGVPLPRLRRAEASMRVPIPEEVGALLDAAGWHFRPFIALCAFAGLRLGEAAAVQLGDIDFMRRTIHIRRQVQRSGPGQLTISAPKYGSERDIYAADELLTLLSQHFAEFGTFGANRWLFMGQNGQPPHQNTVGHWWRTTLKAAGIEGLRLHDLRHFYASGLIASGCDVVTVQRALGHARATTTLNTYSHLWPTAEDRTRAAAGALVASALKAATKGESRSS